MIRPLVRLLLIGLALLAAAPFALSSWYITTRGVDVSGKVMEKREFVWLRRSGWERRCEVMVSYRAPDEPGGGYVVANLDPARFDGLHKGGQAPIRYLRREDLPRVPLAENLRAMHLLPTAKVVGEAGIDVNALRALGGVAGAVLLLIIWRRLRLPLFAFAVAAAVLCLLALILYSEFPRQVPEPRAAVRQTSGRVASIARIRYLFSGRRSRGIEATQPIQVVGVSFVPDGAADPVLAVDLIDEGSLPNLAVGTPVALSYEQASPRTARIEGATRRFPEKNFNGAVLAAGLFAGAMLALLLLVAVAGRLLRAAGTRYFAPK